MMARAEVGADFDAFDDDVDNVGTTTKPKWDPGHEEVDSRGGSGDGGGSKLMRSSMTQIGTTTK
jgi:hypothetical protein